MAAPSNRIVWAVDPFDKTMDSSSLKSTLKNVMTALHSEVVPTFVLSASAPLDWPDVDVLGLLKAQQKDVSTEVGRRLGRMRIPNLKQAKILVNPNASLSEAAKKINRLAKNEDAKAILVASHGRHGFSRLALGSFAETLTLQSTVPLIIVNPRAKASSTIKRVVFATDLSKRSKSVFKEMMKLAKQLGADVTIYHAVPTPTYPIAYAGAAVTGLSWIPSEADIAQIAEERHATAESWLTSTKQNGVKTRIVIETNVTSVSDAITEFAEKDNTDLLAMEARSGKTAALLIGSVARNVARSSPCPVWIMRSK